MILTDVSDQWAITLPGEDPAHPRSKGLHLSEALRDLAVENGMLTVKDDAAPNQEKMCAGLAWEEWLASRHAEELAFHPGEVDRDGIAGSPDAFEFTADGRLVVHEFKFTWYSMKRPAETMWMYWAQIKGYCYMADTRYGCLHVYYVNGNYSWGEGGGPKQKVWAAEFGEAELKANWDMVLGWKAKREREGGQR